MLVWFNKERMTKALRHDEQIFSSLLFFSSIRNETVTNRVRIHMHIV
jgi:hypothetical protein